MSQSPSLPPRLRKSPSDHHAWNGDLADAPVTDRLSVLESRLMSVEHNQQQTTAEVLARLGALEQRLTEWFKSVSPQQVVATNPQRDFSDRAIPSEGADVQRQSPTGAARLHTNSAIQEIAEKQAAVNQGGDATPSSRKKGVRLPLECSNDRSLVPDMCTCKAAPCTCRVGSNSAGAKSPATPLMDEDVQSFHIDCIADLADTHDEELVETVPLESTLWDAAILLGMQSDDKRKWFVGRANRIVVVLLLIVNVTMQGIFLVAIPTTMSGKPYDDETIQSLKQQRLFTGHSYNEINRVSMKTWTANLCAENVHNRLAGTLENIFYYLQSNSFGPPGTMICMLAVTIWILSMVTEIRRAMDVACAVWSLPSSRPESPHGISNEGDGKFVVCMSKRYKVFLSMLVFFPRFIIAFALMYFGIEYLADTPAVGDLILNACALEIVKNIDELLFLAILSRRFHQGVESIQIRVPHRETRMGVLLAPETTSTINGPNWVSKRNYVHALMYVRMAVVAIVLMIGWKLFVEPVHNSTVAAKQTICGYDKDFAYTWHPSSQLPVFATMSAEDNSTLPLQCFYMSQYELLSIRAGMPPKYVKANATLERLVNGSHELCKKAKGDKFSPISCPETDRVTELVSLSDITAKDFLSGPQCRDEDVVISVVRETCMAADYVESFPPLRQVFNEKRKHCSDFADLCKCPAKLGPPGAPPQPDTECGPSSELFRSASKKGIPPEWIRVIQGICPETCGTCQVKASGAFQPSSVHDHP